MRLARFSIGVARLLALVAGSAMPCAAFAQSPPTADCFAGERYTLDVLSGEVVLAGTQTWQSLEQGCLVLHAEEEVTLRIAGREFAAARGTVIALRLEPSTTGADAGDLWQIFALLEDVGPQQAIVGASAWHGPKLPIRALVRTNAQPTSQGIVQRSELPQQGPAKDAIARAFHELARSLARGNSSPQANPHTAPQASAHTMPRFTPSSAIAPAQSPPARRVVAQLPSTAQPQGPTQSESTQSQSTKPEPPTQSPPRDQAPSPSSSSSSSSSQRPSQLAGLQEFAQPRGSLPRSAAQRSAASSSGVAVQPAPSAAPARWTGTRSITLQAQSLSLLTDESLAQGTPDRAGEGPRQVLIAEGPLVLLFRDLGTGKLVQASAQRAVVFLRQALTAASPELDRDDVEGVYFEGEVSVSDGQYTVRSPRMFYDIAGDKAVMLDAVFWTYDQTRGLPLFVRAEEIRQLTRDEFVAQRATVTNSPFLDPELALGARSVTLRRSDESQRTRERRDAQQDRTPMPPRVVPDDVRDRVLLPTPLASEGPQAQASAQSSMLPGGEWQVDAQHIIARAYGVPFFAWPGFRGDPEVPLIRSVRVENRSGNGPTVKVAWNVANLLREPLPQWLRSATLLTDVYANRGVGLGTRLTWGTPDPRRAGPKHDGGLFAYTLPRDTGDDRLKPGTRIDRDGDFRGVFTADHRVDLSDRWSLVGELSHLSDVAVIDALFEEAGETRREFTTRVAGTRIAENSVLSAEVKANLNDFLANEWLLQSQGYSVSKLPELSYVRFADDLLPTRPGELISFGDYRAGRYRLAFDEASAQSRGLSSALLSERALGILPGQSPADRLRAEGYSEDSLTRLDLRQEVVWTRPLGPVKFAPFAVVRATLYDDEFETFSQTPGGNDSTRLWSAIGARASMRFERVQDNVQSTLLDISRLRHIVEPNLTVWAAGTNVESTDLPQYDPRVDDLADGAAIRLGLAQTLQTKRGPLGTQQDVDLLKLNTDFVFATSAASDALPGERPIGRFFESRPEYSALGNLFIGDLAYAMTDATSITASTVFDLDRGRNDISTVGLLLTHAPGFSTLIDLRRLDAQDSTILALWGSYDLTSKYSVAFTPNYNLASQEFESAVVAVTRRSSAFFFTFTFTYNDITGETSFGITLRPYGTGPIEGSRGRFGGFFPGTGGL
jgi:hypothetical protein